MDTSAAAKLLVGEPESSAVAEVLPDPVADIAGVLPLAPLIDATRAAFLDGAWAGRELVLVGAWAVVGAVVAVWRFRWDP